MTPFAIVSAPVEITARKGMSLNFAYDSTIVPSTAKIVKEDAHSLFVTMPLPPTPLTYSPRVRFSERIVRVVRSEQFTIASAAIIRTEVGMVMEVIALPLKAPERIFTTPSGTTTSPVA